MTATISSEETGSVFSQTSECCRHAGIRCVVKALASDQLRERSILRDQLVVTAVLHNLAFVHDEDLVAVADGEKPVSNDGTGDTSLPDVYPFEILLYFMVKVSFNLDMVLLYFII